MPRVFVAYRRDDTQGYSGRLYDSLTRRWGKDRVTLDVYGIPSGYDYADTAKKKVADSDCVLVLIGRRWTEPDNLQRLADPQDLLRAEIETALAGKIRVIPVLIEDARMPRAGELPVELQGLARRNAIRISDSGWRDDVRRLIREIEGRWWASVLTGRARLGTAILVTLIATGAIARELFMHKGGESEQRPAVNDSVVHRNALSQEQSLDSASAAMRPVIACGGDPTWSRRRNGSSVQIDRTKFFGAYTDAFGYPTESQRAGVDTLLSLIEKDTSMTDIRWAAYILATVKHESGGTWTPIEEYGRGRGHRYGTTVLVTDAEGKRFPNIYYGRGYVQLTGDSNYQHFGNVLKHRLYYEPDLALKPDIAYQIMSHGMRHGSFTGVRFARHIDGPRCDYFGARKIVNGTDKAKSIGEYASVFERILRMSAMITPPSAA